jgi:hypothetical protein
MSDTDTATDAGRVTIISTANLCGLLMLSRQRLDQLVSDGVIFRHSPGQFKLVDTIQKYISWLRDDARTRTRSAADSRVRDARAKDIEVKTAQRLSQLVPLAAYDDMIEGFAGVVRSEFAGLAAASSRNLQDRKIIEREVNARLRRIAEYAMAQAIRLETVRGADPSIGANGAGSVGGGE